MALSSNERQKRYIAKLKDAAANNTPPVGAPAVIDIPAIVRWWRAARLSQREALCAEIGTYNLTYVMSGDTVFQEYIDECVKIDLRDRAADYGYRKIVTNEPA
jgi:hypothetical protein